MNCCRRRQNDPCAGILLTLPRILQNVAYARVASIYGGSVKTGSLGQKRIGANMPRACCSIQVRRDLVATSSFLLTSAGVSFYSVISLMASALNSAVKVRRGIRFMATPNKLIK